MNLFHVYKMTFRRRKKYRYVLEYNLGSFTFLFSPEAMKGSKVGDRSLRGLEGSLFNSYYIEV